MSDAGRSASIFRSTCNWPMTSFPRPSSSPRTSRRASGSMRSSKKRWRSNCRASSRASRRWSLGRLSAGRCNTGSAGPTLRRCARSLCGLVKSWVRTPISGRSISTGWSRPAKCASKSIRIRPGFSGLSSQALAEVLNTVMTGTPITQVRDNIYLINVVARAQDEQRVSLSTLRALQLPLPNGRTVPLSQVATFDFEQEYPLIWRRQRVPTLTVQADVASGATPEAAVRSLAPAIAKLNASLPKGYHIDVGGTVEESAQSQASVFAKVPLMLFLMLLFLMAQLHSFSRLALVLSIVPMGLIGIVAALLHLRQAARLRRDPRHSGADGHDRPQCGDPHRADRDRARGGTGNLGRGRRGRLSPASARSC